MISLHPRVLWYALSTALTVIFALVAWGVNLMEGAIQRNSDRARALEIRVVELNHKCIEISAKLDEVIADENAGKASRINQSNK